MRSNLSNKETANITGECECDGTSPHCHFGKEDCLKRWKEKNLEVNE